MPAFIGNLSATEILVIGIVAVLIFGKRLPEVASQTYGQIRRMRQGLDQFRRETGIDREVRTIEHTLTDLQHEVTIDPKSIAMPPARHGAEPVALPAPSFKPLPPPAPPAPPSSAPAGGAQPPPDDPAPQGPAGGS